MTPDFPTVAEITADLYAQVAGTEVDGVIAMDPFVVAQMLRYTGPVLIPSLGRQIGPDEVLPYLFATSTSSTSPTTSAPTAWPRPRRRRSPASSAAPCPSPSSSPATSGR